MRGLQFTFAELESETKTLKKIARPFLCKNTIEVLSEFEKDINSFRSMPAESTGQLQLRRLETIPTGLYGPEIYAAFCGIWDVRSVAVKNKRYNPRNIMFCGIASTKIRLYCKKNDKKPIAMWRLELGAHDSPGCYFHAQILGNCDKPPFPKSIPIPRLPSFFVTPMAAIEYGIGELFQEEWSIHAARNSGDFQNWNRLQKPRLERLFEWYRKSLMNGVSSPWMTLKAAKPNSELFLK